MKKVRPVILTMLMLMVILSVTACGSSNSGTQSSQSTTGASQTSSSAATSTTTAGDETMEGETNQGIIGDVVDDVENGMHEAESGVMDQTGESGNESTGAGMNETTR